MTDRVELVIMKGLPASGKSYQAYKLMHEYPGEYKRVSKDALRGMLDFGEYNTANEGVIRQMRDLLIMDLLADGHSVIVDDTNLNPQHEEQLRKVAKDAHPKVIVRIEDLTNVPLSTCLARDANRMDQVGEDNIRSMADRYLT